MDSSQFDNFGKLLSAYKKSTVKVPFRVYAPSVTTGAHSIDLFADLLMQFFWMAYYIPYGEEFLKQKAETIQEDAAKNLVQCCLDNIQEFILSENDAFADFLCQIDEPDWSIKDFKLEIPVFGINNLHHFIRDYYSTPHISKWPVLLAYWVYRMNYYDEGVDNENDDILDMQKALRNLHNRLAKKQIVPDPIAFIKAGLPKTNRILKTLGFMTFNQQLKADVNPPLTGRFFLSPKHLRFMDGFVWLYHPKYPSGNGGHLPLRYELKESRKVYCDISDYLLKKLPPIHVEAKNGCISKVLSPFALTECIELIEHKSVRPNLSNEKAKPTFKRRDVSKTEARGIIKNFKSRYLDYLCASQLDDYKVVCCIEQRTTESGAAGTEYSFIFTISSNSRKTLLVFENVNPARSTYLVEVSTSLYEDCIDNVFAYFGSDILNKRQKMANGELRINHPGIKNMKRMFHKSYTTWCDSIRNLRYTYL